MKRLFEGKSYLLKVGVVLLILALGVFVFTGFINKPQSFTTEATTVAGIAETVQVTGTIRGETEKVYYAEVSAPIASMDLEVGDEIEKGTQVVVYATSDLTRMRDEAALRAAASESGVKAKVEQSNKNASRYAKASADEQAYRYLYALSRMDADALAQGQYQEAWNIQCESDSISKKISEKNEEIAEKQSKLSSIENPASDEAKNLSEEIASLQGDVAGLQGDLATLPPRQMTPEENAHNTYDANLMEDITRNWTQATTEANTYEGQIMNQYAKEELENSHQLNELSLQTTEENLRIAANGIHADFSGVIKDVQAEAGAVVAKGTPLFTVESTDALQVNVEVSKYDIGKIKTGQEATITVAGKVYDGVVSDIKRLAIEDESDKAKITVCVKILEPDESLILGVEADVDISTEEKDTALIIPKSALYADEVGDYCYGITDGKVVRRDVTTGLTTETAVEILDGLENGERVITDAITDDQIGQKAVAQ